jgi:molybdopterin-guanine dinucleotide biosynthesis protein B
MASPEAGNIIGVVGYKDTGKTRVVEGLVAFLSGKGFIVGTVKHIDHDSSLQPLATDSKRHLDAGAHTVVVVGENIVEILKSGGNTLKTGSPQTSDLDANVAAYLFSCDCIIVEGFKKEGIPKVAVVSGDTAILKDAKNIVAVVSTGDRPDNIPGFGPDEIDKLGTHLIENDILKVAGSRISLVIDGKPVRLNEFVRTSLAGVIQGFITSLRDIEDPSTIELRIRK